MLEPGVTGNADQEGVGPQGHFFDLISSLAKEVILWYDCGMKTAISIPDDVFESADELAEQMGVTRSHLYATAVAEYVAKYRASDVTATLNEVYSEEPSGIGRALRTAQARSVGSSGW